MGRLEKLIQNFRSQPPEVSFSDAKRLLEKFEFKEVRSSGSHHIFRNKDGRKLTIPKKSGQKVKRIYVKKILKLLELEENYD